MADAYSAKSRLHHDVPGWVSSGGVFHIRVRSERSQQPDLINPDLAGTVLDSVRRYHERGQWHCRLFLLMPDHLHALLSFPPDQSMSSVMKNWKAYHTRINRVEWQSGYFDHRIRNDKELDEKWEYIRQNPVVKTLCQTAENWPWVIELAGMTKG
jgi:REP element-mobilizing transposase RayT